MEAACGGCIAIGNFDGVHRGHRRMLSVLKQLAARQKTHSVAVTFHPHPITILRPEFSPPLLTTIAERTRLLKQAGIDFVVVLPVTQQLLSMSASEFFDEFVIGTLQARGMVEGPNFQFGHDRGGNVQDLAEMCRRVSIPLRIVDLVSDRDTEISSSRIRRAIAVGDLRDAVQLLGHPLRIQGVVQAGDGRGSLLGFPTANLEQIQTMVPQHGVYAGSTHLNGRRYVTAVSIGPNLTFGGAETKTECFLDGYEGSLYGCQLDVDLIAEVRQLISFPGPESLVQQIRLDVAACRKIVAEYEHSRC